MGLGIPIIDGVTKIIDKLIPDPQMKAQIQLELAKLDLQAMTAQTDVNKVEAAHRSIFVAGWRPFVGWVCGFGLAYGVIFEPLLNWAARVLFKYAGELPHIDPALLVYALGGMLGIGAMRSFDKSKGTDNDVLPIGKTAREKVEAAVNEVAPPKKKKKFLGLFKEGEPIPEKTPWE
jgi:hypothetical protein